MDVAIKLNVLLKLVPMAVIAIMHTRTIKAAINAYSIAVTPSLLSKNCEIFLVIFFSARIASPVIINFPLPKGAY
jgi:hypothetical protein